MKRLSVELGGEDTPIDIGKPREGQSEIINMAATVERLIGALEWLSAEPDLADLLVGECHPTTSDNGGGNDLVLCDRADVARVRIEVFDIVSADRDGNKKESKSLVRLNCARITVDEDEEGKRKERYVDLPPPDDHVRCFLVTSSEFAEYLERREHKHFAYHRHEATGAARTVLMEVNPIRA